ncbi:alginate O-acetyltransferase AlgX-related protein [Endozoicomonas arenosclerae]|uniref:alginate O-acetyltransferase AlgX-related protein n=1 Tax=Endozoicomonas arenosclerae TaxID=1633495 RepID=UPI00155FBCF5|nr:hypothetical protein [Endozoicomonas arenosclerae]
MDYRNGLRRFNTDRRSRLFPSSAFGFLLALMLFSLAGLLPWKQWFVLEGNWKNGEITSAVGKLYDKEHPARNYAVGLWALVSYTLFGEGQKGLFVGKDGWLFIKEELEPSAHEHQEVEAARELIEIVKSHFAENESQLLITVIPAKWRVVPENLGEKEIAPDIALRRSYLLDAFSNKQAVGQQDIAVFDAYETMRDLGEKAFLRTDTHWTPQATESVAERLSQSIRQQFTDLSYDQTSFEWQRSDPEIFRGDLYNFLPLGRGLEMFGPSPDLIETKQLVLTHEAINGAINNTENILFDGLSFPVNLVGTSYSANERWHFADALQKSLGMEIPNHAQEGKGPFQPMLEYLVSEEFIESPPELVIWEIPERYMGVEGNQKVLEEYRSKQS